MVVESPEWNTRYKVGRVLRKYDLADLHEDLPALWRGESGEAAASLREIARRINVAIVRRAMDRAGADPLDGEAKNAYELLTDDAVSAGMKTQQRNRLNRMGIDVAELESDFVTHQAVHTYLTDALGVSKQSGTETDPIQTHERRINRLRSRTTAVLENSVSALQSSGDLSIGSFDIVVDLGVYCNDCGSNYEIIELLEEGGCDCQ